jgi:hypothetical protein
MNTSPSPATPFTTRLANFTTRVQKIMRVVTNNPHAGTTSDEHNYIRQAFICHSRTLTPSTCAMKMLEQFRASEL